MNLSRLPSLAETIRHYRIAARKSLGQHFLLDENITAKIARAAGDLSQCSVVEIGPGPGGLTRTLLAAGAKAVYAIEKDHACMGALTQLADMADGRLHVIPADALAYDVPQNVPAPRKIVANLPYNIGTELLLHWLDDIARHGTLTYLSLTLMFQKEVARRIAALPGAKEYGRLSILAQWLCEVRCEFDLPPGAFMPPPKVTSSVITLMPRAHPPKVTKSSLEKVTAAGFGQRRKMLRSSLKTLGIDVESLLREAGIDSTLRAEALDIPTWIRLAQCYTRLLTNSGSVS